MAPEKPQPQRRRRRDAADAGVAAAAAAAAVAAVDAGLVGTPEERPSIDSQLRKMEGAQSEAGVGAGVCQRVAGARVAAELGRRAAALAASPPPRPHRRRARRRRRRRHRPRRRRGRARPRGGGAPTGPDPSGATEQLAAGPDAFWRDQLLRFKNLAGHPT